MDMIGQTVFQVIIGLIASISSAGCALLYFRRVRLERPPVGTFNNRDIIIIVVFIITLPLLYLVLPSVALTGFLILTFSSASYIALRPLMRLRYLWPLIILLIVVNIVVTETLLGTRQGWQVYWVLTSAIVLIAVVGISNLYVQGGMRLRHIAWFALFLACYDFFFTVIIPLTPRLADRFEGQPLDPSIGFTIGVYNANLGIGDLLVFSLFMIAAYKGFGRRGAIAGFIIIALFGGIVPEVSPLLITAFIRTNIGIVIPVQTFFGPAAFITYFVLARTGPERSMAQWTSAEVAAGRKPIRALRQRQRARLATAGSIQPAAGTGANQAG
ncbi:MAG: hypothetical protein M3Z08_17585 [Chloroflexota bacterium]|nr:hypothetical protein [Chloroflexota bacterium]